jgi:filamentous hemagglutinin family protein
MNKTLTCFCLGLILASQQINIVSAQIIPDESLQGEKSILTPNTTINGFNPLSGDKIDGGAIRGANLFHSFQEFNVNNGQRVYFSNPNGVQNIFSRVTGNNISNILGTLGVEGSANLFMINPNGIIFGQNARLDVTGSFVASTANSFRFADGSNFHTNPSQSSPLLTVSLPIGLQLGTEVRNIENSPSNEQRNVSFIGNNVIFSAVNTPPQAGDIIISGRETQLFDVSNSDNVSAVNFRFYALKDVIFSNFNIRDNTSFIPSNIELKGKNINLSNGGIETKGGNFNANAIENIFINGTTIFSNIFIPDTIFSIPDIIPNSNITNINITDNAGKISLNSPTIKLTNSFLDTTAILGQPGSISIAANSLTFDNSRIAANPRETFSFIVNSGDIDITADSFTLINNSGIFSQASGGGKGGNIRLNINTLLVWNRSNIDTSTQPNSSGNGGNIIIAGREGSNAKLVRIGNDEIKPGIRSGVGSATNGSGKAGNVNINSDRIELINDGGIGVDSTGIGDAGQININVGDLVLQNSQRIINSGVINRNGGISSNTKKSARAGNINIEARRISLDNQSIISSQTENGNEGNINFKATSLLLLRRGSKISTNGGDGNGGNINIDIPIILGLSNENSDITANSLNRNGGKVDIKTKAIFFIKPLSREQLKQKLPPNSVLDPSLLPSNDITAISQNNPSLSGFVRINASDFDPTKGLVQLPSVVLDNSSLLASSCSQPANPKANSFYYTGRGGLPETPNDFLTSDVIWEDIRLPVVNSTKIEPRIEPKIEIKKQFNSSLNVPKKSIYPSIIPAVGWKFNHKGEVILLSANDNTRGIFYKNCSDYLK